jgi:hypothetical protein
MIVPSSVGRWACALIIAFLLGSAGNVQAHPCLVGRWIADLPCGPTVYEFTPGKYVGNGVWTGCYSLLIAGCPVPAGEYELRMFTGNEGTLSLRDGTQIGTRVANVDLAGGTMLFMNVNYRHESGHP